MDRQESAEAYVPLDENNRPSGGRPLVSVIVPVYNAVSVNPAYLAGALESVCRQTYANLELLIIDDGSTDDSARLCRDFMAGHPELAARYCYRANGGQSSARNFGARLSRGAYLCFLDQDDKAHDDMLETRLAQLDPDTDLLYTDADTIDSRDVVALRGIHRNHGHGSPHPKTSLEGILFQDIVVMTSAMMIRREAFFRVQGFDEHLAGYEDEDLFLRIFETGKLKYLPISTLQWRVHDGSCSRSERMIESRRYYYHKLVSRYTDQGKDLRRARAIAWRFFRLFLVQAMMLLGNDDRLFAKNIAGARETLSALSWSKRLSFGLPFLSGDRIGTRLMRSVYRGWKHRPKPACCP